MEMTKRNGNYWREWETFGEEPKCWNSIESPVPPIGTVRYFCGALHRVHRYGDRGGLFRKWAMVRWEPV